MNFERDVREIRERARRKIEEGAVTQDYGLDRTVAIELLNAALATEIVCVLRYRFHYFMASGIHSASVAAEFLEHANEEQAHADQLARRIKQLGGKPEMDPSTLLERSHSEYREGSTIAEMLREDLIAERARQLGGRPARMVLLLCRSHCERQVGFSQDMTRRTRSGSQSRAQRQAWGTSAR